MGQMQINAKDALIKLICSLLVELVNVFRSVQQVLVYTLMLTLTLAINVIQHVLIAMALLNTIV